MEMISGKKLMGGVYGLLFLCPASFFLSFFVVGIPTEELPMWVHSSTTSLEAGIRICGLSMAGRMFRPALVTYNAKRVAHNLTL